MTQADWHPDRVSDPDPPLRQNLSAQASPVDETGTHRLAGGLLHVTTRFAELQAEKDHSADPELPVDQVVQGDAARRHVAASRPGFEGDPVVAKKRLERFVLDESDLPIRAVLRRISAALRPVPVPLEAPAGDRAHGVDRIHGRSGER
jgi:hypothetical protein